MIRGILRVFIMTVLSFILVTAAFGGGYASSRIAFPPALPPDGGAPADWKPYFPVFWEAWNYVHQDFYKTPIDDPSLVYGAVGGMVDALGDPHTGFTDAKTAKISSSQLQGSFEGIGATVEMREGRLTIVAPIRDSPAERAGLLPNDVVLQVDDTIIQNMDINQAVSLIRGPKGTSVKLVIQRAKTPVFTVSVVRDTIRTPFVESRMIEGTKIAYLRLNDFGATAPDEMHAALQDLLAQKPTGLIFDLRSDPGGYLTVAVDVASEFIKGGNTVLIEKDKFGHAQELKSKNGGLATDIPMVLLVNGGSASASEIVSAAIKDYGRATLIGVKTYGKGSVQNVHSLSDGSELRVTIAHFFSPKGNEINDVGVQPDIKVDLTSDDIAAKRDPQLDAAVKFLNDNYGK
ncbi:MAG: S41 family peptidase [Chloroflexota bacterium]|nr:S41 family peptidase [Chloroflexota bacterium]